jgi:hypothetical protein
VKNDAKKRRAVYRSETPLQSLARDVAGLSVAAAMQPPSPAKPVERQKTAPAKVWCALFVPCYAILVELILCPVTRFDFPCTTDVLFSKGVERQPTKRAKTAVESDGPAAAPAPKAVNKPKLEDDDSAALIKEDEAEQKGRSAPKKQDGATKGKRAVDNSSAAAPVKKEDGANKGKKLAASRTDTLRSVSHSEQVCVIVLRSPHIHTHIQTYTQHPARALLFPLSFNVPFLS